MNKQKMIIIMLCCLLITGQVSPIFGLNQDDQNNVDTQTMETIADKETQEETENASEVVDLEESTTSEAKAEDDTTLNEPGNEPEVKSDIFSEISINTKSINEPLDNLHRSKDYSLDVQITTNSNISEPVKSPKIIVHLEPNFKSVETKKYLPKFQSGDLTTASSKETIYNEDGTIDIVYVMKDIAGGTTIGFPVQFRIANTTSDEYPFKVNVDIKSEDGTIIGSSKTAPVFSPDTTRSITFNPNPTSTVSWTWDNSKNAWVQTIAVVGDNTVPTDTQFEIMYVTNSGSKTDRVAKRETKFENPSDLLDFELTAPEEVIFNGGTSNLGSGKIRTKEGLEFNKDYEFTVSDTWKDSNGDPSEFDKMEPKSMKFFIKFTKKSLPDRLGSTTEESTVKISDYQDVFEKKIDQFFSVASITQI
ncbi:hypothetical protein EEI45_02835 [Erysipelothrix piscisicarius]|uniref:Uncharacterized protein n=1 Tax=Erysipelothrix piscisicarius TaxID=2485784 RepID=A0A3S8RLN3_9FIRM|nr:hypothetical protein [Erysipelothrix piscisicarius]AZK43858.1 hypothetical protein EEI45_02835 [Erysipelothrix piscisicarius]